LITEPRPLRVTHLASGDLWAGAESQLFDLVRALREERDIEVDVVLLNEGLLAARLRAASVPVTVFDERRLAALPLVRALRAHVRRAGTRVLHTHRYKENVLGAVVALTTPGLRTLRTVHGASETAPGRFDLRRLLQRRLDWACARFVQWPVVCVSEPLRTHLLESLPASRLRVVENGIDVTALERRAQASVTIPGDAGRFTVGYFGRLTPVKRVDLVIEIARCLEDASPGDFRLLIFGDGPLREELEAMVRERGLEHCVRFMGFADEPAAYLRQMDALVLTSDHEGLPMVVLEAMTLRVPVVSHAVGAIPALLEDSRAGTSIDGQDPRRYAEAIIERRDAADATEAMVERAYRRVVERFSSTRAAREYIALYTSMDERAGARRVP